MVAMANLECHVSRRAVPTLSWLFGSGEVKIVGMRVMTHLVWGGLSRRVVLMLMGWSVVRDRKIAGSVVGRSAAPLAIFSSFTTCRTLDHVSV